MQMNYFSSIITGQMSWPLKCTEDALSRTRSNTLYAPLYLMTVLVMLPLYKEVITQDVVEESPRLKLPDV